MNPLCVVLLLRVGAAAAPLTLDDALALASKRNTDLQVARADESIAASDARLSYQGVLPRLDLSIGLGHQWQGAQQQPEVVPNPTGPNPPFVRSLVTFPANDVGTNQIGASLTWVLFDGLASWNRISATHTLADAARRDLDETALRLAFEVTRRFYAVVREQQTMQVRRDTATLSAELVKRADALFAAGRATKADTYSTRVNLANDEIAVNAQAAVLERARADLAQILGSTSDAGLEVVTPATLAEPTAPTSEPEPPQLSALLTTARSSRPLLVSRRLAVTAADRGVSVAVGAWWPVLGVQATYQKLAPDVAGTTGILGDPQMQYIATAQLTLSWNAFAGGQTVEGVRRAEAQADRTVALRDAAEQQVVDEIAVARAQLVAAASSVATSRAMLDAAENTLRFAREQLEHGLATQLEVRDAALKLAQARLASFGTLVDLFVAHADLNRAVGGAL